MLVLRRSQGERIRIGDEIDVLVTEIGRGFVKLGVTAPKEIPVHREEIYDAIPGESVREFKPDPRKAGGAAHFVHEGLQALTLFCECETEDEREVKAIMKLAFDKFHKALAILTNREPPVVHPGG